mmetsp:Transcript_123076/g.383156  ORF Transcript_123076/g.383156 Transcript_123076/m.383156 type:complete len:294 (+) Transcript_123076:123-1004(+)
MREVLGSLGWASPSARRRRAGATRHDQPPECRSTVGQDPHSVRRGSRGMREVLLRPQRAPSPRGEAPLPGRPRRGLLGSGLLGDEPWLPPAAAIPRFASRTARMRRRNCAKSASSPPPDGVAGPPSASSAGKAWGGPQMNWRRQMLVSAHAVRPSGQSGVIMSWKASRGKRSRSLDEAKNMPRNWWTSEGEKPESSMACLSKASCSLWITSRIERMSCRNSAKPRVPSPGPSARLPPTPRMMSTSCGRSFGSEAKLGAAAITRLTSSAWSMWPEPSTSKASKACLIASSSSAE